MSRLKPINSAKCPHCASKNTVRVGYSDTKKASLWKCQEPGCGQPFTVALVLMVPSKA